MLAQSNWTQPDCVANVAAIAFCFTKSNRAFFGNVSFTLYRCTVSTSADDSSGENGKNTATGGDVEWDQLWDFESRDRWFAKTDFEDDRKSTR